MNGERIDTAQYGRHRFGLSTQHIYVRIVYGFIPFRSFCMDIHLTFAIARRIVGFHDVSPQVTGSPQFSDLHEILGTGSEVETDFRSHFIDLHSCIRQFVQIFNTGSQWESQLLNDRRSWVIENISTYFNGLEVFVGSHFFKIYFYVFERFVATVLSFPGESGQRIDIDSPLYFFRCNTSFFHNSLKCIQDTSFFTSGDKVDFHTFQADVFQEDFHICFGKFLASIQYKTQWVDTAIQYIQCFFICFSQIFHNDILTYIPIVVIFFVTSHKREFAG